MMSLLTVSSHPATKKVARRDGHMGETENVRLHLHCNCYPNPQDGLPTTRDKNALVPPPQKYGGGNVGMHVAGDALNIENVYVA